MRDRSRRRRRAAIVLLVVAACAAAGVWIAYARDIGAVSRQVASGSSVASTRHGPVEFAERGSGPAVVVLHGAGGGYDQGLAVGRAYGGDGFRWIAPSRFGYLRTPLPADASTAAQADAVAELLDGLGVERVAILAMSGGVPPALQFALRHPARTSALVLLSSAPYTPLSAAEQMLPLPAWLYQALFASDFPYWVMARLARPALESVFDVKPEARPRLTAEEAAFVAGMVDGFAPVSKRTDGLRNEAAAIDPRAQYPLERIAAPTLVVHARDDGINPFAFGEHTARGVPGALFLPLDNGGHLLLGHVADVRARVEAFLRAHAAPAAR